MGKGREGRPTIIVVVASWLAVLPAQGPAQTTVFDCIPPPRPSAVVTDELMRDFAAEIRAEFLDYFDAAQAYLTCLDGAQRTARTEVQAVLRDFEALFPR